MRCLALAQGWRDSIGGEVTFVSAGLEGWFLRRLASDGISVISTGAEPGGAEDAEFTLATTDRSSAEWIVTDGYAFNDEYQKALKSGSAGLLFIDDYGHCTDYSADIVLNQNLHANDNMYRHRQGNARLLLGTRYVLLRREFRRKGPPPPKTADIGTRVLITLGGGDPENVTSKVVSSLSAVRMEDLEVVVVVGPSNPHEAALHEAAEGLSGPVRLQYGVENMVPLMQWADLAVCAGGSTCWELAHLGVPSVVLVLAENQLPIAEALAAADTAECLGWHSQLEPDAIAEAINRLATCSERRAVLSRRGRELVDGAGVDRVIKALNDVER